MSWLAWHCLCFITGEYMSVETFINEYIGCYVCVYYTDAVNAVMGARYVYIMHDNVSIYEAPVLRVEISIM